MFTALVSEFLVLIGRKRTTEGIVMWQDVYSRCVPVVS